MPICASYVVGIRILNVNSLSNHKSSTKAMLEYSEYISCFYDQCVFIPSMLNLNIQSNMNSIKNEDINFLKSLIVVG